MLKIQYVLTAYFIQPHCRCSIVFMAKSYLLDSAALEHGFKKIENKAKLTVYYAHINVNIQGYLSANFCSMVRGY